MKFMLINQVPPCLPVKYVFLHAHAAPALRNAYMLLHVQQCTDVLSFVSLASRLFAAIYFVDTRLVTRTIEMIT